MRFIPTNVHGVLDYLIGVLLIAAPWLFGFADTDMARWIPIILGVAVIVYSLLTRYELGVIDAIPMTAHLWVDAVAGLFLAASPWLFGFSDIVWMPHLIVGILEIVVALTTETEPRSYRTNVTA